VFDHAAAYDLLHPPEARWAREGAHLCAWAGDAIRVLELACGTGAVAAGLARPGRTVVATDLSPAMIARARAAHQGVEFAVGDLRRPPAGPFGRMLVLGNSLNLLPDRAAVAEALAALRAVAAPGGRLLLQLANPDGPRYREPRLVQRSADHDGRPLVAVKSLVPAAGGRLLTLSWHDGRDGGADSAWLLDLRPAELEQALRAAGWSAWSLHGGLDFARFDPAASDDLVVDAAG
jgi:SAM-dependent methyltransferase